MLENNTRIHFIGIGGIGMSALAQVLLSRGYIISGSDAKPNNLTRAIEEKGGRVYKGHSAANISGAQVAVYSSSISKDNPELAQAKKQGLLVLHRAELLAQLMKEKTGIAVTGAHGKTTTTAMISEIMVKGGYDPTCVLGGESLNLKGNAYAGKGGFLVAEADESDGSHLYLEPKFGIITNIDREHVDYYKDMNMILRTCLRFMERIKPDGVFFGLIDDESIRKILISYDRKFATFGFSKEADLYAKDIKMDGLTSEFDCIMDKRFIGKIRLNVPGVHNVKNAIASTLCALYVGIDFGTIAEALFEFRSTKRRFEIYPATGNVTLIEDYAHHPTEIAATLAACRLLGPKRITAVFQPHRYTRTKELSKEFGACFGGCDELILTNIYAASEKSIEGVSVKNIYDAVMDNGFKNAHIMPKENIADYLYDTVREGDLVAVLGAGDIGGVAEELGKRLRDEKGI